MQELHIVDIAFCISISYELPSNKDNFHCFSMKLEALGMRNFEKEEEEVSSESESEVPCGDISPELPR
jgi:hypothetical protein